jgi:hypothetical protein
MCCSPRKAGAETIYKKKALKNPPRARGEERLVDADW